MDELQTAVKTCFQKYADFNGRAARPEFWWFCLFWLIVLAITGLVSRYLYGIAALAMLIPGLAVGSRRLHDTGKSGWFQLIGLIPLLGALVMIYLMAQPGQPGSNQYGEPPNGNALPPTELAPDQN